MSAAIFRWRGVDEFLKGKKNVQMVISSEIEFQSWDVTT